MAMNSAVLTHQVGMNHLPNELLRECFSYLPVPDVLNICRLVSKRFYEAAGDSCRNRFNKVTSDRFYKYPSTVMTAFPDKQNLPWSAISLFISTGYQGSSVNRHIADVYGDSIFVLEVHLPEDNYDNISYILGRMPNLRVFVISQANNPRTIHLESGTDDFLNEMSHLFFFPPTKGIVTLPKLHKIEVDFCLSTISLGFLEFILTKTENCLDSFTLKVDDSDNLPCFLKFLELLKNIRSVSLDLSYYPSAKGIRFWEKLCQHQRSNIRDLSVDIMYSRRNSNPTPTHFEHLEKFITNCAQLQTLSLNWSSDLQVLLSAGLLNLPSTRRLEVLYLDYDLPPGGVAGWQGLLPPQRPRVAFPMKSMNISSQDFPVLKEVHLTSTSLTESVDFRHIFYSNSGAEFSKVVNLTVESYNVGDNWKMLFPNLKILDATVNEPRCLEEIFREGNTFSELTVRLKFQSEVDVNLALFQYFKKPSRTFLGLRMFVITTAADSPLNTFSESSAILFSLLPRLDYLELCGVADISEACRANLLARHRVVEFVVNDGPEFTFL